MQNAAMASNKTGGFVFNLHHYLAKHLNIALGIMCGFITFHFKNLLCMYWLV